MKLHAFALLCCIGFAASSEIAERTLYVQKGKNVEVRPHEDSYDITACDIITNKGKTFAIYKNGQYIYDSSKFSAGILSPRCTIEIYRMTEEDVGIWELQFTKKNSNVHKSTKYTINVKNRYTDKSKEAIPYQHVWVYPGQQVLASFNQEFENFESCVALTPSQKEIDLKKGDAEDIKLSGQCGFKMTAKKEYAGVWTLITSLKNDSAYFTTFEVLINDANDLKPNITYLSFEKGESGRISAKTEAKNIKVCIFEDPQGVTYGIQDGSCFKDIKEFTKHHEGTWKVYYGFVGMERLIEYKVEVSIYDVSTVNSTVTHSNGNINLMCRIRGRQMDYCNFIRPDGELLHMTIGVGNENYGYYGKGTPTDRYANDVVVDCGITIFKPKADDYGTWRCLVKTGKNEKWGRILKVTSPARSNSEPVGSAKDVYVKQGQPIEVNCKTDEVLNYCWIQSPNGTIYNVNKDKRDDKTGAGLEMGECKSEIESEAYLTDTGKWSCHMGVEKGPEVKADFKVFVEESYLSAAKNQIMIDSHDTELVFKPLPNSGKVINTCRWVSPNGRGINVERQGRYLTETSTTHCKLSILTIDFEEDVGKWSCYAHFEDGEEGNASTTVAYRGIGLGTFLSITVVISLLVCSSIGLFVLVVYKRRMAAARLEKELILEKPSKYP